MNKNQKGFALVGAILLVALIGLVGFIGWKIWQTKNSTKTTPVSTLRSEEKSYLSIKEWGIKIALRDADKIQFKVTDKTGPLFDDQYDGEATPSFKPEFLQDKTCTPGLSLYRSKKKFTSYDSWADAPKIGEYYYVITGIPASCSSDPQNNPDDKLQGRFIHDFDTANIVAG